MISKGTAWLRSAKDTRWNVSITCWVGGGIMPSELEDKIKELKKKYGNPPKDLQYGYMKD